MTENGDDTAENELYELERHAEEVLARIRAQRQASPRRTAVERARLAWGIAFIATAALIIINLLWLSVGRPVRVTLPPQPTQRPAPTTTSPTPGRAPSPSPEPGARRTGLPVEPIAERPPAARTPATRRPATTPPARPTATRPPAAPTPTPAPSCLLALDLKPLVSACVG